MVHITAGTIGSFNGFRSIPYLDVIDCSNVLPVSISMTLMVPEFKLGIFSRLFCSDTSFPFLVLKKTI
jgi:hypothetical protein